MTDVPENVEAFNRVALEIFARLYDSFPKPLNIDRIEANAVGFSAVPADATDTESWNIGTMAPDVIEWLAEEDFLRYSPDPNHAYGVFWKVRLTLKGLTILGYVPTSLKPSEPKEPLIEKIKRALASGAATTSSESIKLAVSEIFKLALAPGAAIAAQMMV